MPGRIVAAWGRSSRRQHSSTMQRASCMYGAKFLHVSREAHTELMTKVNCAQLLEGAPNHQIAGNTRRKDQRLLGKAAFGALRTNTGFVVPATRDLPIARLNALQVLHTFPSVGGRRNQFCWHASGAHVDCFEHTARGASTVTMKPKKQYTLQRCAAHCKWTGGRQARWFSAQMHWWRMRAMHCWAVGPSMTISCAATGLHTCRLSATACRYDACTKTALCKALACTQPARQQ